MKNVVAQVTLCIIHSKFQTNNRITVHGLRNLRATEEDTSACGSGESFPWRISIACMA